MPKTIEPVEKMRPPNQLESLDEPLVAAPSLSHIVVAVESAATVAPSATNDSYGSSNGSLWSE